MNTDDIVSIMLNTEIEGNDNIEHHIEIQECSIGDENADR